MNLYKSRSLCDWNVCLWGPREGEGWSKLDKEGHEGIVDSN